mmetsp:Transcript_59818/g.142457  ORF Transcript_59818/g.142457 Transcript_59818/m.142457 type:complete len:204 (-) Transcript_59818:326-937(-)
MLATATKLVSVGGKVRRVVVCGNNLTANAFLRCARAAESRSPIVALETAQLSIWARACRQNKVKVLEKHANVADLRSRLHEVRPGGRPFHLLRKCLLLHLYAAHLAHRRPTPADSQKMEIQRSQGEELVIQFRHKLGGQVNLTIVRLVILLQDLSETTVVQASEQLNVHQHLCDRSHLCFPSLQLLVGLVTPLRFEQLLLNLP